MMNNESGEKDIGHYKSGNGENVKTNHASLIKVELPTLDKTGKCETGKN